MTFIHTTHIDTNVGNAYTFAMARHAAPISGVPAGVAPTSDALLGPINGDVALTAKLAKHTVQGFAKNPPKVAT